MLKQEISINVDTNPADKKFSERLSAIRKEFEQHQIDLSERIKRYQGLLADIKTKSDEAKELGFSLKEYGLYVISEEFVTASDASMVGDGSTALTGSLSGGTQIMREFIQDLAHKIENVLDSGWQDSSKREEFLKDVKRIVQELVLKEYQYRIKVNDFHKYLNRLVDIVLRKF